MPHTFPRDFSSVSREKYLFIERNGRVPFSKFSNSRSRENKWWNSKRVSPILTAVKMVESASRYSNSIPRCKVYVIWTRNRLAIGQH